MLTCCFNIRPKELGIGCQLLLLLAKVVDCNIVCDVVSWCTLERSILNVLLGIILVVWHFSLVWIWTISIHLVETRCRIVQIIVELLLESLLISCLNSSKALIYWWNLLSGWQRENTLMSLEFLEIGVMSMIDTLEGRRVSVNHIKQLRAQCFSLAACSKRGASNILLLRWRNWMSSKWWLSLVGRRHIVNRGILSNCEGWAVGWSAHGIERLDLRRNINFSLVYTGLILNCISSWCKEHRRVESLIDKITGRLLAFLKDCLRLLLSLGIEYLLSHKKFFELGFGDHYLVAVRGIHSIRCWGLFLRSMAYWWRCINSEFLVIIEEL